MAFDKKTKQMKRAPSAKPGDKTFGPNGSFKGGDVTHDRLAISAAARSRNVGHISPSTASDIQAKAKADLARLEGKPSMKPKGKPPMTKAQYERTSVDRKLDKKMGVKEGSKKDNALDAKMMKAMNKGRKG